MTTKQVDFCAENDVEDFWRNMAILTDEAGFDEIPWGEYDVVENRMWASGVDYVCKRKTFTVDISIFEKPPEQRHMEINGVEFIVKFLDYDPDDDSIGIYKVYCDGEVGYE